MGAAELDRFLLSLGIWGFYPMGIWVMLLTPWMLKAVMFMASAMIAYPVKFDCWDNVTLGNRSITEVCSSCPSNSTWIYDTSASHNLIAAFDLVCSRAHFVGTSDAFFFGGGILGSLTMGYLSDKFGRRWLLVCSSIVGGLMGLATFWVPNIEVYVALRFVTGISYVGLVTQMTYKSELFPSKYRFVALTCDVGWVIGNCLFPLFAFLIPDWRLLFGILLTATAGLAPLFFFLPESVPWLIRVGRKKEAYGILAKVAASRGVELKEDEFMERIARDDGEEEKESGTEMKAIASTPDDNEAKESETTIATTTTEIAEGEGDNGLDVEEQGFFDACKNSSYVLALITSGTLWSYCNIVYIAIAFSYGTLGGDRLLNYFYLGLTDLPGKLLPITLIVFLNRRPALFITEIMTGAPLLAIALARLAVDDLQNDLPGFRMAMCIISKLASCFVFELLMIYNQETFPTLLRARSYLVAMLVSRVASISGSYVAQFMRTHAMTIELSLGTIGIIIAFLVINIAETKNEPLPQTINDLNDMKRRTPTFFWNSKKSKKKDQQICEVKT